MEWAQTLGVLVGLLVVGLAAGLPVAFTLLVISIGGLYVWVGGLPAWSMIAGLTFDSVAQFALVPVPLFILMGELLLRSGLATATLDAADQWIGRVPARLSLTSVVGGSLFGALSGSSMASVAMLGSVLLPEMEKKGYKPQMSVGAILAAGGLAVLIPPSALAVLLGATAKVSIAELLIAGLVPGVVLAALYAAYFVGRAFLQPELAPSYRSSLPTLRAKLRTLLALAPLGAIILVVTGFIFFGVATPSEAAAMGALAAGLLAAAKGKLSRPVLRESLLATISTSTMVLMVIVGSRAFSQLLAATGATSGLVSLVAGLQVEPVVLLILMLLVILIAGCFIDAVSIMLITLPIFLPVVEALKFDPIWFSILVLIQLELSGITPPFGLLLFVLKGVHPSSRTVDIYRAIVPIVIIQFILVALIIVFPDLALYLPSLMKPT